KERKVFFYRTSFCITSRYYLRSMAAWMWAANGEEECLSGQCLMVSD
ncbi:hypothetical protein NPIL_403161, partial [Nephila pilipes]